MPFLALPAEVFGHVFLFLEASEHACFRSVARATVAGYSFAATNQGPLDIIAGSDLNGEPCADDFSARWFPVAPAALAAGKPLRRLMLAFSSSTCPALEGLASESVTVVHRRSVATDTGPSPFARF